jgi:hypothetical protein
VVQQFLLDHLPQLNNERIMRLTRRLRETYYNNPEEMHWEVFKALHGDKVDKAAEKGTFTNGD